MGAQNAPEKCEKMKSKIKYQGGFSEEVAKLENFREYAENQCGYFSHKRTAKADKALEKELRKQGLGKYGVLDWLGSTSGRRYIEGYLPLWGKSQVRLLKMAEACCKYAFAEVAIWNHPDHGGSSASFMKLSLKMKNQMDHFANEENYRWREAKRYAERNGLN